MNRRKKTRKQATRRIAPERYLVVCEGEKTEPLYFKSIKSEIDKNYKNRFDVKELDIKIDGTGRNTESLVKYTMRLVKKANVPYNNVWCIFDKDDFGNDQFNNAIEKAISENYKVGWSNEAIELWFLLHFEFLDTGITRSQYIKRLNAIFKKRSIKSGKYEKNQEDIYYVLKEFGSIDFAIKNAKKLLEQSCENFSPAKMNPATTVFKLVEELQEYLVISVNDQKN